MAPDPRRKQTTGRTRGWWRQYFHDHPGASSRQEDAYLGDKTKVYCKECMQRHIVQLQALDQDELARGARAAVRSEESIVAHLWTLNGQQDNAGRGYLSSRSKTLIAHLKTCSYQPDAVRQSAIEYQEQEKHARDLQVTDATLRRVSGSSSHAQAAVNVAIPVPNPVGFQSGLQLSLPGPSGLQDTPQSSRSLPPLLVQPLSPDSAALTQADFVGTSSSPVSLSPWQSRAHTPSESAGVSSNASSPSIAGFELSRRTHTSLRHSISVRQLGPPPPQALAWTDAVQARFESLLIRLTVAANLPLSWVQCPVWLTFCDEFLPAAVAPSRKVLTERLLPAEVEHYRSKAIASTPEGEPATLQGDGWTGINSHHLLGFMMTADRQAHTVRVIDVSKERKTAANFLAHIEDTLRDVKEKWNVEVVGFTSDASGESRAARLELLSKYTYLIVLDCYAHQINLIVGDYFDSKSTLLDVTDQAEELITWLRRRTFILARIRDVQQSHGKTALAVIRPVLTRWTSHYLAFRRLLELQSTLSYIIADDNARGGTSTFMAGLNTSAAKSKARQMIALMQNGAFWHSLNRVKLHLEPLAVAANVTQAAHCRLDQVLLIFGFLYRRFSTLPSDLVDDVASRAVIDSIETRWSKADQAIFVAAVILNPMYHLDPFADHPQFIQIELEKLFARLWTRFYRTTPPTELYIDLREYLEFKGRFSTLPEHVKLRMEHARQQVELLILMHTNTETH
ncbi:hypothetical protein ACG7TL_004895 [Trametes sanguinea]